MTLAQQITELAQEIAADLGRDWSDCGEYERQSYRDEAQRLLEDFPELATPKLWMSAPDRSR